MSRAPRLLHAEFELHAYYIYTQEQIKFPFEEESSFFIPYTCTRSLSFIRGRFFHGNFRSIFLVFFSLPSFILLNTNIQQCVVKFFYRPCVFFFFVKYVLLSKIFRTFYFLFRRDAKSRENFLNFICSYDISSTLVFISNHFCQYKFENTNSSK